MSRHDRILAALASSDRALRPTEREDQFLVILNGAIIGYVERKTYRSYTGAMTTRWHPFTPSGQRVDPWDAFVDEFNAARRLTWEHLRRTV